MQNSSKRAQTQASDLKQKAEREADELVKTAKKQADTIRREAEVEAKDTALRYKQQVDEENKERLHEVRSAENRITQREESLDKRSNSLITESSSSRRCKARSKNAVVNLKLLPSK